MTCIHASFVFWCSVLPTSLSLVMSSTTKAELEQKDFELFSDLLENYRSAIQRVMNLDRTSKYCDMFLEAYYCELVAFCDTHLDYPEYRKRLPKPPQ